jgi:hypothetical protein
MIVINKNNNSYNNDEDENYEDKEYLLDYLEVEGIINRIPEPILDIICGMKMDTDSMSAGIIASNLREIFDIQDNMRVCLNDKNNIYKTYKLKEYIKKINTTLSILILDIKHCGEDDVVINNLITNVSSFVKNEIVSYYNKIYN